jgi:hypothetical protein
MQRSQEILKSCQRFWGGKEYQRIKQEIKMLKKEV